ncbi:MAG: Mur ligase domain-containing protein, partial [Cyanobacteria bacterium P01_H01_bin.153]
MDLRTLVAQLAQVGVTPELAPQPDHPALSQSIKRLCTNSQACQPGDLFIGMPGTRVDGGDFWPGAIAAGAIAALVSPEAYANRSPIVHNPSALVLPFPDMA